MGWYPVDLFRGRQNQYVVGVFSACVALLTAGFYVLPDQAGRNLLLYATALAAHGFVGSRHHWRIAFGGPGGWAVLALVLMPAASLAWSVGGEPDTYQDLLVAAYCVLAVYFGAAVVLASRPQYADRLATIMVVAGSLVGSLAIGQWALAEQAPGAARMAGTLGLDNPVHASVLLLGATLPVLVDVLAGRRAGRWLLALVVPVCFVVLAGARAAAGAYLLAVVAIVGWWRLPRVALAVAAGCLVAVAGAVLMLGADLMGEVWLSRGLSYRDVIWEQVWGAYRDCSAIVGCGIATPLSVDVAGFPGERAHSLYFAALYHQGALGVAVFAGALGGLLWVGLRGGRERRVEATWGWAWMLGYVLLANVTSGDHVLVRGALFWACFWVPVMVVAAMHKGSWRSGRP